MQLTEEEAYQAMFKFLKDYYFLAKTDDVGALLGSMQIIEDGKPLDMAMWQDWLKCVEDVKNKRIE